MFNMRKIVLLTFIFFSLILVSCKGIGGTSAYIDNKKAKCTLVVKSQNNAINFRTSSRTILPTGIDVSSLNFYLWGKNKITGDIISPVKVQFIPTDDETTGEIDFDFPNTTIYELSLGATKNEIDTTGVAESVIDSIKTSLIFLGLATADLRYNTRVKFYLTPYVSSGYGTVALKLYMPWPAPTDYTITAGLYDLYTNNEIRQFYTTDGGDLYPSSVLGFNHSNIFSSNPPETANYKLKNIKPGIYNFKVIFSDSNNDSHVYVYSDTIMVHANQETAATIAVPNVLEYKPSAAPSNFTAAYAEPEYFYDEYYPVEFIWKDNSYNETHFQLEIMDVSNIDDTSLAYSEYFSTLLDNSTSTEEKDSAWYELAIAGGKINTFTPEFYGDSSIDLFKTINAAGSLVTNNSFIVMNMLLGKKYLARICAVNRIGNTDYAYLDITNSINQALKDTGLTSTFTFWNGNPSALNLYRIRYILNGGYFYDSAITKDVTTNIALTVYKNQDKTTPVQLMKPIDYSYDENDSSAKATLRNEGFEWLTWRQNSVTGNSIGSGTGDSYNGTYNDYKNISLFAQYTSEVTSTQRINVTNDSSSDIFIFTGNSEQSNDIDLNDNRPVITNDFFTVDSNNKYLYIIIKNPKNSYEQSQYTSLTTEITDKYGIPSICEGEDVSHNFTYCKDYVIDLTEKDSYNQNKFEAGTGKLYYITVRAVPRNKPSLTLYYTLKFTID